MENLENRVTALKPGKNLKAQRTNVFLNGKFAFSLDNEVIAREKITTGKQLSSEDISRLTGADRYRLCLNSAYKLLTYRPRSEAEIKERLEQKGYNSLEIDRVTVELKRMNLLNDQSFAEFWKDHRNTFKHESQKIVRLELKRKGVESEIVNQVVGQIDDAENAYKVAISRVRVLDLTDFQAFRQKLGSYLQRRGFNYNVINKTLKRIWEEKTRNQVQGSYETGEIDAPE
jgi:regulatory protein